MSHALDHEYITIFSYCPTVIVVGPNQHIHINKGRMYMTRWMTLQGDKLPPEDCHAALRQTTIESNKLLARPPPVCNAMLSWDL